jgi:hypothetical protein
MAPPSPWIAYYETLPGGQYRITDDNLSALQASHPMRLLFAEIGGKTAHVLLLDYPFRIADRFISIKACYLRRIAVIELPGWGPALSGVGGGSPLRNYKLKSARYVPGEAHRTDAVELVLEHQKESFKIWHIGCPAPLLKCEAATFNQEGAMGKKLVDLQNMRLVAAD